MKPYSLVATLLLVLIALSSCKVTWEEDENTQNEENYTKLFIKEFGLIDPQHNWGFPTSSKSRACDPNGGTVWVLPPAISAYEREAVRRYLNQDDKSKIKTVEQLRYTKYYITHVYANPHTVYALNGEGYTTKEKMNQLVVGETSTADVITGGDGCVHSNDFNAALNDNFDGHMVMYDSGTYDFAYHCSADSKNYNNYIIIAGADVDAFMDTEPDISTFDRDNLEKYFYVCFDYQMRPDDGAENAVKAKFDVQYTVTIENPETNETSTTNSSYVITYNVTEGNTYQTKPTEAELIAALLEQYAAFLPAGANDSNITITNYDTVNVSYVRGEKWVDADGIYDDWVVRIVGNAKRLDEGDTDIGTTSTSDVTPVEEYAWRIMVEDLSIRAKYVYGDVSSDWDFNDLVINATIDDTGKAKIKLMALGGTLPIYIYDKNKTHSTKELHRYFIDSEGSYTTMINTGVSIAYSPVDITADLTDFEFDPDDYKSIRVLVEIDGELREVEAPVGKPTGKICVPVTKRWMGEYRNIKLDNPGFEDWINNQGTTDWMYTNTTSNN